MVKLEEDSEHLVLVDNSTLQVVEVVKEHNHLMLVVDLRVVLVEVDLLMQEVVLVIHLIQMEPPQMV